MTMNIEYLKEMVVQNAEENISILIEFLEMYEHENKVALKNLFENKKDLIHDVVINVLMIYSLLSFTEDKNELKFAQENLGKLINVEPLVKDVLAIYLQIIEIQDINPNLSEEEAKDQNKKLIKILTSY